MVSLALLAETVANGLLLGGIYALAALGLSLVFGIMDIVNLAHGHMLMLGGYIAIILFAATGITPIAGMFLAIGLLFVLGVAVQHFLLESVVDEGLEQPIIVLFGLALMLENMGQYFLGSDARSAGIGIEASALGLGSLPVSFPRLVTFVISALLIAAVYVFLKHTTTGQAIRATAQNTEAARYMGIPTDRIYLLTMGIGASLAGASGALLSMLFPIDPYVGWSYLLTAFAVVVLGGVGSVAGTLVGGLFLGVAESVGALYIGGSYRNIITFTIFLLVLLVRPQGLFGTEGGGE